MKKIRSLEILSKVTKKYPKAWKQVDQFLDGKGKDLPKWADWCFLPAAAAYSIVSSGGDMNIDQVTDVSEVSSMAAWRLSKGVYRFDQDLFESLWFTPIDHKLPIDLFFKLPEYGLYIETPGKLYEKRELHGFFVHLEEDVNQGHIELRLLLDTSSGLVSLPIHLNEQGIHESLIDFFDYSKKQVHEHFGVDTDLVKSSVMADHAIKEIMPLISLVLYICSTNSELINSKGQTTPNRAQAKKIKKKKKFFAAQQTELWEVGLIMGAKLRAAKDHGESKEGVSVVGKKGPSPHSRRAHWHSYWIGPKSNQKLELKWVNLILVKADLELEHAVLHKVEK